MPVEGYKGFYSHPALKFLVVMVVNDGDWQGKFKSTLRTETLSAWTFWIERYTPPLHYRIVRIVNQQALLARYDFLN